MVTPKELQVYYKTSQLAEIFGVSVTAVNNWIDEGRFIDFTREPHKHARIPHFTMFRHRDGRGIPKMGMLGFIPRWTRRLSLIEKYTCWSSDLLTNGISQMSEISTQSQI